MRGIRRYPEAMQSRWPRFRRLLKWTGLSFLLVLVLLVGVYLLRDRILARPLANLVAEQMSQALGGKFTLERIEGDYFREIVVVGLRTEAEPPDGPLRRIELERAAVRFNLRRMLEARRPASLRVCTLLHKPDRTEEHVDIDYLGFSIPDVWVVGYGLDYAERYRTLPFIAELPPVMR